MVGRAVMILCILITSSCIFHLKQCNFVRHKWSEVLKAVDMRKTYLSEKWYTQTILKYHAQRIIFIFTSIEWKERNQSNTRTGLEKKKQ